MSNLENQSYYEDIIPFRQIQQNFGSYEYKREHVIKRWHVILQVIQAPSCTRGRLLATRTVLNPRENGGDTSCAS